MSWVTASQRVFLRAMRGCVNTPFSRAKRTTWDWKRGRGRMRDLALRPLPCVRRHQRDRRQVFRRSLRSGLVAYPARTLKAHPTILRAAPRACLHRFCGRRAPCGPPRVWIAPGAALLLTRADAGWMAASETSSRVCRLLLWPVSLPSLVPTLLGGLRPGRGLWAGAEGGL